MSSRARSLRGHGTAAFLVGALVAALVTADGALAAPPGSSTPTAKPAPSPTAEEIVGRYVAARGGIQKLRGLRTLRQEGRVNAGPGRDGLVLREIKRPGKIRFELTVQGVTNVLASDGQHGWKVAPLEGVLGPQPLPDEVLIDAREQADIDGPLVDWKSKGSRLELVGREALDGHDVYKVKVLLKSGGVLTAYLDVKSASLVRTEAIRQVRGRPVRIETTLGDYRKTKGILFPHLVEVRAAGRPQLLRIMVDKVEVNPLLADTRFSPPA